MSRSRRFVGALIVAFGAAAFVLAGAAAAMAQSDDCSDHACAVASPQDSGDITNNSGAVLVEGDGGSPTVNNDSGAVLVHADGGSPTVNNGSGAVDVEANGASPTVNNESGAVLVEGEREIIPVSEEVPVFVPQTFVVPRVVEVRQVTRLPVTGSPISEVLVMALGMLGFGVILLGGARFGVGFRSRRIAARERFALWSAAVLY